MMLLFNYYPRNTTLEFPEPDIFQAVFMTICVCYCGLCVRTYFITLISIRLFIEPIIVTTKYQNATAIYIFCTYWFNKI